MEAKENEDLQSSQTSLRVVVKFAYNRTRTKKLVRAIMITLTTVRAGARFSVGLTRLEMWPGGGAPAGIFDRSIGVEEDILIDDGSPVSPVL